MEIQLWKELLEPYQEAVDELEMKFNHMRQMHRVTNTYSPIESVKGRVKSISSILEKMSRKKIPFERLEEEIEDIAGIRLICQFEEDILTVAESIRHRTDMEVLSEKDYLKQPKASGYRSYHMIVRYTVQTLNGPKKLQAEIQIRTMAMNFWATTEHSLQYKYRGQIPETVAQRLQDASLAIDRLDTIMSTVRSDIIDAQIDLKNETSLVQDIMTMIENLYEICSEREVRKIQEEFYRIYKLHNMEELTRFHRELDLHTEGYRAQSR